MLAAVTAAAHAAAGVRERALAYKETLRAHASMGSIDTAEGSDGTLTHSPKTRGAARRDAASVALVLGAVTSASVSVSTQPEVESVKRVTRATPEEAGDVDKSPPTGGAWL